MKHLIFGFYLLALVAGTASLSQALLFWQRYRKAVIKWYGFFLLSLYLILLSFLAQLYSEIAELADAKLMQSVLWILTAGGGLAFVFIAPYFYHALIGLEFVRWRRICFFALDVLLVLAALVELAFPTQPVAVAILMSSLFGMIAYGLVLITVKLKNIADPILKKALVIFLTLTVFFFPFMLIDSVLSFAKFLSFFDFIEGLAQPLYFMVLNCLTIVFGLKYMNRPAYADNEKLSDYFISNFGITDRESEIIRFLLAGNETKDIAQTLFISPKTVENHVYNIYQKLNVKNRVQLYQMIHANTLESTSAQ